jgi:hypothetical protein
LVISQNPKGQITKIINSYGHRNFSAWNFFGVWTFGFCDFQQDSPTLRSLYHQHVVSLSERSRRPFGAWRDGPVDGNSHTFAPGVAEIA